MINRVDAFWCRIPSRANFGDALTPWLIEKITGSYPKFLPITDPRHKYIVTGSILALTNKSCTVWGAGIMNTGDKVSNQITVTAVRGPLSHFALKKAGLDTHPVYGDPALLLPLYYQSKSSIKYKIGLALHFSDFPRITACYHIPETIKLIDMQQPVEKVIDDICSCETVASSSLHGLIASHAYEIPASWIVFKPLPSGDGSKFLDYLLSIGRQLKHPYQINPNQITVENLQSQLITPPTNFDQSALIGACPFNNHNANR